MHLTFIGAHGGVGTTTLVAATGLELVRSGQRVTLVSASDTTTIADVVGCIEGVQGHVHAVPGLWIAKEPMPGLGTIDVFDGGTLAHTDRWSVNRRDGEVRLLVVRNDYLSPRAFHNRMHALEPFDGFVMLCEKERALGPRDIEQSLPMPLVGWAYTDPAVARAVDAGLLAARPPRSLQPLTERIIDFATSKEVAA